MVTNKSFQLVREYAPTLSAGVIPADLMNLKRDLDLLHQAGIRILHFDVMDGCFVPVMTVGPPYIKGLKTELLKDVHLMIQNPESKVEEYVKSGADLITIHVEACNDCLTVLRKLATMENANDPGRGVVRGVALNPDTPVKILDPLLGDLEMISVLAVDPCNLARGYYDSTPEKFKQVQELVSGSGNDILLCLDGGVTKDNITGLAKLGADLVVSGSALFKGGTIVETTRYMLDALRF